jgi:hypothetical protein
MAMARVETVDLTIDSDDSDGAAHPAPARAQPTAAGQSRQAGKRVAAPQQRGIGDREHDDGDTSSDDSDVPREGPFAKRARLEKEELKAKVASVTADRDALAAKLTGTLSGRSAMQAQIDSLKNTLASERAGKAGASQHGAAAAGKYVWVVIWVAMYGRSSQSRGAAWTKKDLNIFGV